MPVFYFHLWCDGEFILDPEGGEHADLDAARSEAIAGARCILSGEIKTGSINLEQRLELHDEHGGHLLTVPFADAVTVVRHDKRCSIVGTPSGGG